MHSTCALTHPSQLRALEDSAYGKTGTWRAGDILGENIEETLLDIIKAAEFFDIPKEMVDPFLDALAACFVGFLKLN